MLTDWFFPGQERTKKVNLFIVILLVIGITLGGVIPFSKLINFLFPLTGVAGLLITLAILIKTIKVSRQKKQEAEKK